MRALTSLCPAVSEQAARRTKTQRHYRGPSKQSFITLISKITKVFPHVHFQIPQERIPQLEITRSMEHRVEGLRIFGAVLLPYRAPEPVGARPDSHSMKSSPCLR
jgi:hypothetical protein